MKIISRRDVFPELRVARYNVAAWKKADSNNTLLIGREVKHPGDVGEPDNGVLKLFELDQEGLPIQERIIWTPSFEGINLEDPRVLEGSHNDLIIGMTAVVRDKKGTPLPFPAIVKIDSHHTWNKELPPFLFIGSFGPGKNLTPLDSTTFLFRPESFEYNHKLVVFSIHRQIPEHLCDINFPTNLPWAMWRIGTTLPPLWINQNEALFLIHGITIEKPENGGRFIYSIGRAKLVRKDNIFQLIVADDPLITPDDFLDETGLAIVPELHPNLRRVVYCCGGVVDNTNEFLRLFVNVGDRATYEVKFRIEDLKNGLF